jgi:hypothetical protein
MKGIKIIAFIIATSCLLIAASLWITAISPLWKIILGMAISMGIMYLVWKIPGNIRDAIVSLFSIPFIKKILLTILLGGLYATVFYLYYSWIWPWVKEETGIESRWSLLFLILLLSPVVGAGYYLFSAIWPTTGQTAKGIKLVSFFGAIAIITFSLWPHPYRFFDYKTGESVFWLCPIDQQVFYSDGYCPTHGDKLLKGEKSDVRTAKEKTFSLPEKTKEAINKIKEWREKKENQPTRPVSGIYKLPADGTIVSKTIAGRELNLKTDDRFQLTQLGQADRYTFVNHNIPSHEISERVITMRTISDGKIELMSNGKNLTVQAQIFR